MVCQICKEREVLENDTVCYICEEQLWDARAEAWEMRKKEEMREEGWDEFDI